jgi:capsid protein
MQNQYKAMAITDFFKSKKVTELESQVSALQAIVKKNINASYGYPFYSPSILREYYTGEKTPGEMGAAKDYMLEYNQLRIRSWQSFLESEITQTVIGKYCSWVIGTGLYVQSEPEQYVLAQEGISNIDPEFINNVNTRFNLWVSSRHSDAAGMFPINELGFEAYKNAIIGGDVLVINYPTNGNVNQQIIDGAHVMSPDTNSEYWKLAQARGNRIEYGVEIGQNNEHVAYYVRGVNNKFYRVERIGANSGRLMAYLVYGNRYRLDNVRGLPLISAVLETLRKLDRYKEATVGGEEERQKIAFTIEHGADSTGENPFLAKLEQAKLLGMQEAPETKADAEYEAAATKVATTTNKQAINLPIGAKAVFHESKMTGGFKDFYTTNIQFVCAAVGIPYEVALAMYNSNYSASRAAIKEWEHTLKTNRQKFAAQYYQPFYNLWLEMQILSGKINAPGYIKAFADNNIMAIEAYQSAKWMGENVPHIDPLKEVMAERLKLGDDFTPLTDYDQASERLASGDFNQNITKVKKQKEHVKKELGDLQPKPTPTKQATQEIIKNMINETVI